MPGEVSPVSQGARAPGLIFALARILFAVLLGHLAVSCSAAAIDEQVDVAAIDVDDLLVVDCVLPGKIRRIGRKAVTVGPGRKIRTSAVECGIRGGQYDIYDRANYETSRKIWLSKAQSGDPRAQNYLGEIYERGLGVDPDLREAAKWYRLAADQNYAPAQVNLGGLYEQGLGGLPQDNGQAIDLYREASGMSDLAPAPELQLVQADPEYAGPVIQILDPLVPEVRGIAVVPVDQGIGSRTLIGRVLAPAGLLSLTVNDRDTAVTDNGTFRSAVTVAAAGSPVTIVAIDQLGRRGERKLTVKPAGPAALTMDFGNYHALVIGNDRYEHLTRLSTARADANAVAAILKDVYGFNVTVMLDAKREQIMDALNAYNNRLTERDNFLIYYAGHGNLDQVNNRGHWLPVDAKADSNTNWIPEVVLTDMLRIMTTKHVLVVADSCYSGSLTRSLQTTLRPGQTKEQLDAYYRAAVKSRSRTALTSGGLAPVLDTGGGGHSIFAGAFIDILKSNTGVLEGQVLWLQLSARVAALAEENRFEQIPQYAPIKASGHESGDFFLVPSGMRRAQTESGRDRARMLAAAAAAH